MKNFMKKVKSNKGFTMQDVVIGILVLAIFVGAIGSTYIAIYKMQSETKLSSVASLCAIQIIENIDKISYDEVTNGLENHYRELYQVPDKMNLNINIEQYNDDDTIKKISLTISYEFSGDTETILFEKLKAKET